MGGGRVRILGRSCGHTGLLSAVVQSCAGFVISCWAAMLQYEMTQNIVSVWSWIFGCKNICKEKELEGIVFVCCGCCNKTPQT